MHGINLLIFSIIPYSFISVLLSPKIDSFFKKLSTMNKRSGLFLSIIVTSNPIMLRFFIFLSICKSSAKLSKRWNATKSTFSYLLIIRDSYLSSFLRIAAISSYYGVPVAIYTIENMKLFGFLYSLQFFVWTLLL